MSSSLRSDFDFLKSVVVENAEEDQRPEDGASIEQRSTKRAKASFASRMFDSSSPADATEVTFERLLASQPSTSQPSQPTQPTQVPRHHTKASFATRLRDEEADARARGQRVDRAAASVGIPKVSVEPRSVGSGSLVLWAPADAQRESGVSMSIPQSQVAKLSSRHVECVKFLHEKYTKFATNAGCVVRDDAESEPLTAVCAFIGAVLASRCKQTKNGVILVLCAPNSIMAWSETIKNFGVLEVATAKSAKQAEEAFERAARGDCAVCVLSHDTFRNTLESAMKVYWLVCVYDEVHRLKSGKSKAYAAANLLHKKVFRIGLSDKLFSDLDGIELWTVMNFIAPWKLGDNNLFTNFFLKPINDGHRNKHTELATKRVRELHSHLSEFMTPPIAAAALYKHYAPEINGTDDSPETAKRAIEALAKFEKITVSEMAEKLLAMDKRGRDELRWRVVSTQYGGGFATALAEWQRQND
jgi:hypothetical protein